MTMFFDSDIDRIFRRMGVLGGDIFEGFGEGPSGSRPIYYGYTMTVGPDGRPIVQEFGSAGKGVVSGSGAREPVVDTIVDEKEKVVKLIAEMPGVEKADVKLVVDNQTVDISAEHGEKKYHARVPLSRKVDEDSAKATYTNGILQLVFGLVEERPAGKTVEVE